MLKGEAHRRAKVNRDKKWGLIIPFEGPKVFHYFKGRVKPPFKSSRIYIGSLCGNYMVVDTYPLEDIQDSSHQIFICYDCLRELKGESDA